MPSFARGVQSSAELKAEELRKQMITFAQRTTITEASKDPLISEVLALQSFKSAPPTRDRVSAAIALVRARQAARSRSPSVTGATQQESPKSAARTSRMTTIVAQTKGETGSPARSPHSFPQPHSPSSLVKTSGRNMPYPLLRSPLSPKSQDHIPQPCKETTGTNNTIASPAKETPKSPSSDAFAASNVARDEENRQLALPPLVMHQNEENDQENSPEDDRHESETPVSSSSDASSNFRVTSTPVVLTPVLSSGMRSTSNDSDEFTLDTQMLNDVGRFIDAVHNKHPGELPVIQPVEGNRTLLSTQERVVRPTSTDSSEDQYVPVSQETLAGIGEYIDAMTNAKGQAIQSSETCSFDEDDKIPLETKDGIEAFIDALHNKSPSREDETKYTLYLSSSDDTAIDEYAISDVDAYYGRQSEDLSPSGDNDDDDDDEDNKLDDNFRLLEEVLSDHVESNGQIMGTEHAVDSAVEPYVSTLLTHHRDNRGVGLAAISIKEPMMDGDIIALGSTLVDATASCLPGHAIPFGDGIPQNDSSSMNEVVENLKVPFANSDDALDDAVNAALVGEFGSSSSDEEIRVKSLLVKEASSPFSAWEDDVSNFSTSSPGKVMDVSVPGELVENKGIVNNSASGGTQLSSSQIQPAEMIYAEFSPTAEPVEKVENTLFDESHASDDVVDFLNAFLGFGSSISHGGSKNNEEESEVEADKRENHVAAIHISNETIAHCDDDQTHCIEPSESSGIDSSLACQVEQDTPNPMGLNQQQSSEGFDLDVNCPVECVVADAPDDEVDMELVNAFLNGPTGQDGIHELSPQIPYSNTPMFATKSLQSGGEYVDDFVQKLVATIGEEKSAVFEQLAWGANSERIAKLKEFVKAVIPVLSTNAAPLVAEAQIRGTAFRLGVAAADLEQVIDHLFGTCVHEIRKTNSTDSLDLHVILNDAKFETMEEVDESANITAFLSRMVALEAGGHFGEGDTADVVADEAVEVDLGIGFVNKTLEAAASDEAPWWNEDVEEEGRTNALTSRNMASLSSRLEQEIMATNRYHSMSPRKSRIPTSPRSQADPEQMRALQNQMAHLSSQQRLENARSYLINSLSIDEVPPSLSLTKVPSLIGELETMLEARENSIKRSKHAKKAKWISPWEKRWRLSRLDQSATKSMPVLDFETSKAPRLEGVAAALKLPEWRCRPEGRCHRIPVKQQWRLAYKDRTADHPGYSKIQVFSLYATSIVIASKHPFDDEPWEYRDVKQRFLHEQSISMSRNWFGAVLRKRGNDRYREPVANPKSMEMPMENLPGEGEWLEEWYTTWQQRHNETKKKAAGGGDAASDSGSDDTDGSETYNSYTVYTEGDGTARGDDETTTYTRSVYTGISGSRRSQRSRYNSRSQRYEEDDDSWEDPPECGTFQNVKQKIGERLSLVHFDYLSSLRQSRWRKRYFPRGTFPYK